MLLAGALGWFGVGAPGPAVVFMDVMLGMFMDGLLFYTLLQQGPFKMR